jgi:prokaryotic ubiquitin-like protein Pup
VPKTVQKQKPGTKQDEVVEDVQPKESPSAEELKAATDELLDEIDALLEVNAEEFVASYIQKGGE